LSDTSIKNLKSKINNLKSINFAKFSSIRVGPVADVYMIDSHEYPDGAYLIGSANNLLIGPQHPPLMKLSKAFDYIKIIDDKLHIGAATPTLPTLSLSPIYREL